MNSLVSWCVNCGKDAVRCKCKKPVINADQGKIEGHEFEPKIVREKPFAHRLVFGRGS